jgi:hypothetical protein
MECILLALFIGLSVKYIKQTNEVGKHNQGFYRKKK